MTGLPTPSRRTIRSRAPRAFLSRRHGRPQFRPGVAPVGHRQADRGQQLPVQRHVPLGQLAGQPGHLGGEHHADRDRVAVPEGVPLQLLDGVPEGVPVVEHLPLPGLAQVGGDHARLDRDRPLDELAGVRAAGPGRALRVRRDEAQDLAVRDEPGLDDLGEARHVVAAVEGFQRRQVGEHPGGRVERADQVLARRDVDRGLAADRRVDHAEQRRRHVDDGHAAQPGRGGEPGEVGRRSPADADHAVGPGHLGDSASHDHSRASTATSFAASPAGTPVAATRYPAASSARQAERGQRRQPLVVDDGHRLRPLADQARAARSAPRVPTTTSYGCSPPTWILATCVGSRVVLMRAAAWPGRRPPPRGPGRR